MEMHGSQLARNTLLNLTGQVVPLLVGILAIPFIIRGLGVERFGILSLAWVVLGYFSLFDVGLGRATTKFIAEALGKGKKDEVPHLLWTTVAIQGVLGLMGAFVLMSITPLLVERVLTIPAELLGEAKTIFYILALAIPVILVSSSFSGVLEAAHRFDLLNAVRIPSSTLTFLLPLVGVMLDFRLSNIVVLILLSRFAGLLVLLVIDLKVVPKLEKISVSWTLLPRLFTYGGWVTITNIVSPVLVYLDRFLIASLLSMASVAYYTAPYEIVTRLWIIPASLTTSLFPAFSALEGMGDRQKIGRFFSRSVKYELLALSPVVLVLVLFPEEILRAWLGTDFANHSKVVIQILAMGVLVNSLAHIPYTLLQGIGRPDIPAKFHLLELPFYIGIAWVLVSHWGIVGAALAWTIRVVFDAILLFSAVSKICQIPSSVIVSNGLRLTWFLILLLTGAAYGMKSLTSALPFFIQWILFISLFGLFAWSVWRNALEPSDRSAVLKALKP